MIDPTTGTHGVRLAIAILPRHIAVLICVIVDVEIHHLETAHPIEFSDISIVAEGPLRAAVKSVVKYGQSTITVTASTMLRNREPSL